MEHFTCDKCGYPIEHKSTIIIDGYIYDICSDCKKKIMERLSNKGTREMTPKERKYYNEIRDKFDSY